MTIHQTVTDPTGIFAPDTDLVHIYDGASWIPIAYLTGGAIQPLCPEGVNAAADGRQAPVS